MAKKRVAFAGDRPGKGFIRSKNGLMVLTVLCCGSCSMWLLWSSGGPGILEKIGVRDLRNPIKQMLFDRFNSSTHQLQALALLISSLDQGRFFECMNQSVADAMLGSSLLQTLEALNSEMDCTQGQQGLIGRHRFLDGRFSIQVGCVNSTELSMPHTIPQKIMPSMNLGAMILKDSQTMPYERELVKSLQDQHRVFSGTLYNILSQLVLAIGFFSGGFAFGVFTKSSNKQFQLQKHYYRSHRWSKNFLVLGIFLGLSVSLWIFVNMNATIAERMKETLVNMCDERARMLQDQFNVSMNHVHALVILVSTFHHGKQPSAIDQQIFAEYTARTAFERPLMSGVAYALRVVHAEREEFEKKHGWKIKKMETEDQSLVKDDYNPEELDSSPFEDEYAPA